MYYLKRNSGAFGPPSNKRTTHASQET